MQTRRWPLVDGDHGGLKELPIHAPGYVPWWPRPDVKLLNIMVHVLNDTTRHAGHADILREQLDGRTGIAAGHEEQIDTVARDAHRAKIERAAKAAACGSDHAGLSDTHGTTGPTP